LSKAHHQRKSGGQQDKAGGVKGDEAPASGSQRIVAWRQGSEHPRLAGQPDELGGDGAGEWIVATVIKKPVSWPLSKFKL